MKHNFQLHPQLDSYDQGRRIYSQNWQYTIPRHLV